MTSALIEGFLLPWLGERYIQASATDLEAFRHSLRLSFLGHTALADFGAIMMSLGYAFWCAYLIRQTNDQRWLGYFGLALAVMPAFALLSGFLRTTTIGMLAVIIGWMLWNIALGIQLIRNKI